VALCSDYIVDELLGDEARSMWVAREGNESKLRVIAFFVDGGPKGVKLLVGFLDPKIQKMYSVCLLLEVQGKHFLRVDVVVKRVKRGVVRTEKVIQVACCILELEEERVVKRKHKGIQEIQFVSEEEQVSQENCTTGTHRYAN
jgi:hypothetical protein